MTYVNELIGEDELLAATQCSRKSHLIEWLDNEQIPYKIFGRKRRIVTTRTALNKAFIGEMPEEMIEFL